MNNYGSNSQPFLFVIDFEMLNPIVIQLDQIDGNEILYKINDYSNFKSNNSILKEKIKFHFEVKPPTFHNYLESYKECIENIKLGNTYLINLTFPSEVNTNLTFLDVFKRSDSKYKLLLKDKFVLFSPETFVKINNGIISSYPMKGTIDAGIENAEEIILNDSKEKCEHATIVDLIRNDLSIVSKNVKLEKYRYLEYIKTYNKTLIQVSSKITGILSKDYKNHIGDTLISLLPAGSISGAPKKKTLEIINKVEKYKRGYYTGVFGYFDGVNLESSVMIRFIEKTSKGLIFKSGGGITFLSEAYKEYNELIDKVYVPFI